MTTRHLLGPLLSLLFLCPWIIGATECNAFLGAADKASTDALIYNAKQLIDEQKYDEALVEIAKLSTAGRNGHDGRVTEATAYAGKCGMNFLNFAQDVANQISSKKLMEIFLLHAKSYTSYAHCLSAETLMLGVTSTDMTKDDYVFLAFLSFLKVGAALASDTTVDANNDGSVDGGVGGAYDAVACALDATITGEIGASLNIAMNSLTSAGVTSVTGSGSSGWTTICGYGTYNCNKTTAASFTGNELKVIRTVIRANEIGLNSCGAASNNVACICL